MVADAGQPLALEVRRLAHVAHDQKVDRQVGGRGDGKLLGKGDGVVAEDEADKGHEHKGDGRGDRAKVGPCFVCFFGFFVWGFVEGGGVFCGVMRPSAPTIPATTGVTASHTQTASHAPGAVGVEQLVQQRQAALDERAAAAEEDLFLWLFCLVFFVCVDGVD